MPRMKSAWVHGFDHNDAVFMDLIYCFTFSHWVDVSLHDEKLVSRWFILIWRGCLSRNINSRETLYGWCRKCFCHVENLQIGTRRIEQTPPKFSWVFSGPVGMVVKNCSNLSVIPLFRCFKLSVVLHQCFNNQTFCCSKILSSWQNASF
jgi:hypothetical protein